MEERWSEHQRHWARHFTSVPKGFCRLFVLKLLRERPMSGAELMNTIEERTQGQWRPSPGSIYPILRWLDSKGLIKIESVTEGEKRYALTEKGQSFLEEAMRFKQEIMAKLHGQQSMIHEMFHDTEGDALDRLVEEVYTLIAEKRETSEEDVAEILRDARDRLRRVG